MNTSNPAAPRKPVLLIIMDGIGVNPGKTNNAVALANTPNLDRYFSNYPHTTLQASGTAVGLPDGQMGNSEVGHLTMGCGSIVRQDLCKINDAIDSGKFFENPILLDAIRKAKSYDRPVHLLGLVSDGGVHSHLKHLRALIEMCKRQSVKPLLHMITDGRDTPPKSAITFLNQVLPTLKDAGGGIATITGRFYAMDRDHRWDRTELAWRALIHLDGRHADSPHQAIESAYEQGETDEFLHPVILPDAQPIEDFDQIISFNFRKDRPRQIIAALGVSDFTGFDRGNYQQPVITCLMPYDKSYHLPFAFEPEKPEITLAQVISEAGLSQFHCAETEKYPHVTYFLNGQNTETHSGETQLLIPSPKVRTYDQQPEMSAPEVANAVINTMKSQKYPFIVVNFANGDMVGHSAIRQAIIEAVEALDREVGRVLDTAVSCGYSVILTADHGNCEEMVDPVTHQPHTHHTQYPVPCMIIDEIAWQLSSSGGLSNIAPTILQIMGLNQPKSMEANSLLLRPYQTETPSRELEGVA